MILRYKIVSEESAVASGGVQIYAHRGTREYFPENTIPAYQFAMRMHANWLDAESMRFFKKVS